MGEINTFYKNTFFVFVRDNKGEDSFLGKGDEEYPFDDGIAFIRLYCFI